MRLKAYITTSWDDGHPSDLVVAEMLEKHGIPGTFYIPKTSDKPTMSTAAIRSLSHNFEIGSHSLDHAVLTRLSEGQASQQIFDSKRWIEDTIGAPCTMFCPPHGRFGRRHLPMVQEAGYLGLRSVELASLDYPRWWRGLFLMPTSVQAHSHRHSVFLRNAAKRAAFRNLWQYICRGRSMDWPAWALELLRLVLAEGGVFHLWGHSWNLQDIGQLRRLDEVLGKISQFAPNATLASNGQICRQLLAARITAHHPRPLASAHRHQPDLDYQR